MRSIYSVAICPPENINQEVRTIKNLLAKYIGWYPSKNSDAHFSINNFAADGSDLFIWENFLQNFCKKISCYNIHLTKTDIYPQNGTLYLSPDEQNKSILKKIMSSFHSKAPIKANAIVKDPHMTIARQLNPDKLKIGLELCLQKTIDIRFICNSLSIRKFDTVSKQYKLYNTYPFMGEGTEDMPNQLSLF